MGENKGKSKKHSNAEKPISLQPLKFDDAVSALLKARPESRKPNNEQQHNGWQPEDDGH